MTLKQLGYTAFFKKNEKDILREGLKVGRVVSVTRMNLCLATEEGLFSAVISGKFRYEEKDLPVVGDWVVFEGDSKRAGIRVVEVFPRKTLLLRGAGVLRDTQVLCANIDIVFIVSDFSLDFSVERIERYITLANQASARFVVLLNKSDETDDKQYYIELLLERGISEVYCVSAKTGEGISTIASILDEGQTGVFLGSSGVGKTSIINAICNTDFDTGEVREKDEKGRHTTTNRQMIFTENNSMIIDSPGIREVGMSGESREAAKETFPDLEEISKRCSFRDCTHTHEKNCAIIEAVEKGEISAGRYENYLRLLKEIDYQSDREVNRKRREDKRKLNKVKANYARYNKKGF